jgi:hypothetical protein
MSCLLYQECGIDGENGVRVPQREHSTIIGVSQKYARYLSSSATQKRLYPRLGGLIAPSLRVANFYLAQNTNLCRNPYPVLPQGNLFEAPSGST